MKRLKYSLLAASALLFCGASAVQAQQRNVDLQPTMVSPQNNMTINEGENFFVKVTLKNNGPDVIHSGDTIFYHMSGDQQTQVHMGVLQDSIPVGQEVVIMSDSIALTLNNNPTSPVTTDFCIRVMDPAKAGIVNSQTQQPITVSYTDVDTSNNTSCATITIVPQENPNPNPPSGINDVAQNAQNLVIYPSPAQSMVNFNIDLQQPQQVYATVTDLAGRVVLQKDLGNVASGSKIPMHLNVSNLTSGMYLIKLNAGDQKFAGKFIVK